MGRHVCIIKKWGLQQVFCLKDCHYNRNLLNIHFKEQFRDRKDLCGSYTFFKKVLLFQNKVKIGLWSVSEEEGNLFSNFFRIQLFLRAQYLWSIDRRGPVVSQRLSPLTHPLAWCHPPSCDRLLQSQAV